MNLQAMFEIVINLHSNSQFDLHFLELWVSVNVCINKCTISIKDFYIWVQLQWNSCSTYDLLSVSRVLPQTCLALHCIALHCSASASARCPVWVWLLCMSGSSKSARKSGIGFRGYIYHADPALVDGWPQGTLGVARSKWRESFDCDHQAN